MTLIHKICQLFGFTNAKKTQNIAYEKFPVHFRNDSLTFETAYQFAQERHRNQWRHNGDPYITHPERVAQAVQTEEQKIVAILHDVIEYKDATIAEIRALGASESIIEALSVLIHASDQNHPTCIAYIPFNDIAYRVKLADLADNLSTIDDIPEPKRSELKKCCEQVQSLLQNYTHVVNAFFDYPLTTVMIPASVTSIAGDAFSGSKNLMAIHVHPENQMFCSIDGVLFSKDQQTLLHFPRGIKGEYVIPNYVTCIGLQAFVGCEELRVITIPSSVIQIQERAFADCTGLTSVIIPDSIARIRVGAFQNCTGLTSITIPRSVKKIEALAFQSCTALTSVILQNPTTEIEDYAFDHCLALRHVIRGDAQNDTERAYLQLKREEECNRFCGCNAGDRIVLSIRRVKYEFRWCPEGTFVMGSPENEIGHCSNESQHNVTISKGFWLLVTPVTQGMWMSFMPNNPSYCTESTRLPVEGVTWDDCQSFIQELNDALLTGLQIAPSISGYKFSLPTEAQWEYACRAGTTTAFNNGANLSDETRFGLTEVANYDSVDICEVGTKMPNAWGFLDMHGNVDEWCSDWYDDYPTTAQIDPTGPVTGDSRVLRGGDCYSCCNSQQQCRSASRDYGNGNATGFRLALVVDDEWESSTQSGLKSSETENVYSLEAEQAARERLKKERNEREADSDNAVFCGFASPNDEFDCNWYFHNYYGQELFTFGYDCDGCASSPFTNTQGLIKGHLEIDRIREHKLLDGHRHTTLQLADNSRCCSLVDGVAQITRYENNHYFGHIHGFDKDFVLGFDKSYGYSVGDFVSFAGMLFFWAADGLTSPDSYYGRRE